MFHGCESFWPSRGGGWSWRPRGSRGRELFRASFLWSPSIYSPPTTGEGTSPHGFLLIPQIPKSAVSCKDCQKLSSLMTRQGASSFISWLCAELAAFTWSELCMAPVFIQGENKPIYFLSCLCALFFMYILNPSGLGVCLFWFCRSYENIPRLHQS